jgi:sphingomyelin phosphodiesterase acid-like 3
MLLLQAILASHIGPGYFAKVANVRWYVADKNKIFHRLLHDYSDVIRAAVFGHEHTDSFRLVYDDNGNVM